MTEPIVFNYGSSTDARTANLVIFAGDGTGPRPDRVGITDNADLINEIVGADGGQWDTLSVDINIPAGVSETTVQLFSEPAGQTPAADSLLWEVGALRVPGVAELDPDIDIEKYTLIQIEQGDNVCADGGKPQALTMEYVGGSTISNTQDGKAQIKFDILNGESPVRIISGDKENPFDSKAKVWFDSGIADISLGETFVIDATNDGATKLKADTYITIMDGVGNILQTMKLHTSCSKLLELGDLFAASLLIAFLNDDGASGSLSTTTGLGYDADVAPGPEGNVGDTVVWSYVVTNTGEVPLSNIIVTDDQGVIPVYISGDDNTDGILDLNETWLYQASGTVVAGQYANIGDVVGTPPLPSSDVVDSDPSHHFAALPSANVCEDGGKPQVLTMEYVGGSIISNTQEGKAQIKFDVLNGESPVRIISGDKENPFDSKAKVWFDSVVADIALGDTFQIDATNDGATKLKADTYVSIMDGNGNILQTVKLHTSCSKVLSVGDQFGGVLLVDFILE